MKNNSSTMRTAVITGVGIVIGASEAILFFGLGEAEGKLKDFKFPKGRKLVTILTTVAVTSLLTAFISSSVEAMLLEPAKDEKQA